MSIFAENHSLANS